MIRHCVEESNVNDDMCIMDPTKIRHVTVKAGKIESMSGMIDPASHLNLDFPDHRVTICIIAEKLELGAPVKMDNEGFLFANVEKCAYGHYGYVDYTQRLVDLVSAVKANLAIMKEKKIKEHKEK